MYIRYNIYIRTYIYICRQHNLENINKTKQQQKKYSFKKKYLYSYIEIQTKREA